ncbi:MAG: FlxA-like family protein [Bacillota bacterium]|nr:FlxA-like family protein [Bacillota bacterium]
MNISSISNTSNNSCLYNGKNNEIEALQKQKTNLQNQIRETNESKLSDDMKRDRIKEIQDQIQLVDLDIQRIKSEKINPNKNSQEQANNSSNSSASNSSTETGNTSSGMTGLIQADAIISTAKKMNSIKTGLHNRGQILKTEIKLDESRGGGTATSKRKTLQKIKSTEALLDKKAAETNTHANKKVNAVSKEKVNTKNGKEITDTPKESTTKIHKLDSKANQVTDKVQEQYKRIDILL